MSSLSRDRTQRARAARRLRDRAAADLGQVSARVARTPRRRSRSSSRGAIRDGHRAGYDDGYRLGLRRRHRRGAGCAPKTSPPGSSASSRSSATPRPRCYAREATGRVDIEDQVVAVAFEIAQVLVGHELAHAEQPGPRRARARARLRTRAGPRGRAPAPRRPRRARRPGRPRARAARSPSCADAGLRPGRLHRRRRRLPHRRPARRRARPRPRGARPERVPERVTSLLDSVLDAARPHVAGRVARVLGLNLEVVGLHLPIGSSVAVETDLGPVIAEVVAVRDDELVCMPLGDLRGVRAGDRAHEAEGATSIPVGAELLGRVLDGLGRPIDGGPPLRHLAARVRRAPGAAPADPPHDRHAAPARRARDRHADAVRPRSAHGHLRGLRRRQVDAALDDHPRHRSAGHRARADR